MSSLETHIPVTSDNHIAIDLLAEHLELSRQKIKSTMQKGAVWLTRGKNTQRIRRAKKKLQQGDELHFYYNENVLDMQPPAASLLADEGAYSVWYKPYGMLSQGSKWGDHCTITAWAESHLKPQRNAFIVHRLDRAATGIILVAHEKNMAAKLSALFQARELQKSYLAKCHGLIDLPANNLKISSMLDGKEAITVIKACQHDKANNCSIVELQIVTGRKHQIRRHLADLGHPIIGERLYDNRADEDNLQLCAFRLAFICPISQTEKQYVLSKDLWPSI